MSPIFWLRSEWHGNSKSIRSRSGAPLIRPRKPRSTTTTSPPSLTGRKKAVVIVSDALRYEVADELSTRIRGENKFSATIEAMLGVLPSYTQLGMAALLPHTTLAHSSDGDPVLVDGQKSDGTANRSKILNAVGGTAIQARDFIEMKPSERRDLYSSNQVLYVYHDTIDATGGDKAVSEHRTFTAAADAVRELIDIVKKLASANATNIIVTADHGFLYQRSKLAEQFNQTVKPQGEQIVKSTRRYVLGARIEEGRSVHDIPTRPSGLSSDLEVQIPNSIQRIVQPGAGYQFVHGGASLQEIVVPVIQINKRRIDTVEPVNVDIHPRVRSDHHGADRRQAVPVGEGGAAQTCAAAACRAVLRRHTDLQRAGDDLRLEQ